MGFPATVRSCWLVDGAGRILHGSSFPGAAFQSRLRGNDDVSAHHDRGFSDRTNVRILRDVHPVVRGLPVSVGARRPHVVTACSAGRLVTGIALSPPVGLRGATVFLSRPGATVVAKDY